LCNAYFIVSHCFLLLYFLFLPICQRSHYPKPLKGCRRGKMLIYSVSMPINLTFCSVFNVLCSVLWILHVSRVFQSVFFFSLKKQHACCSYSLFFCLCSWLFCLCSCLLPSYLLPSFLFGGE